MNEYSTPRIQGFHAHVYFDAQSIERARALCEEAARRFPLKMGRVHERPVGPHPDWSCQLAFVPEVFGELVPKNFAIALPLASRWYPPEHQGKAMGLAGMGNSGTVLASLFAPLLAKIFGWNAVLGLACIPLSLVFVVYMLMAKDSPNQPAPRKLIDYFEPLRQGDAWWLMAFYAVTFGGFVGLAASLPIYFTDQFGLSPVTAGY